MDSGLKTDIVLTLIVLDGALLDLFLYLNPQSYDGNRPLNFIEKHFESWNFPWFYHFTSWQVFGRSSSSLELPETTSLYRLFDIFVRLMRA